MTTDDTEGAGLTLRPLDGPGELGLFNRFGYVLNDELADDLASGRRRAEWLWVAVRGDQVLARVGWWTRPGRREPFVLDVLDVEAGCGDVGERLLREAIAAVVPPGSVPPPYCRFVPPGWRDDAEVRGAVEERMAVAERTGARLFVERLRLEWRPGEAVAGSGGRPGAPLGVDGPAGEALSGSGGAGSPLPASGAGSDSPSSEDERPLRFRPVRDPDELVALMAEALTGTLDAYSRHDLVRMPPYEAARRHYEDEFARYDSPRDWWRIATTPDGDPVGLVIPAHNSYHPIIAYLAVLPAHRGRGHVDALLAEGTRTLAAHGAARVRASTDLANVPMAEAFRRAGYAEFERQIDMTWE